MDAPTASQRFAGLRAAARVVHASVSTERAPVVDSVFPLSEDGLERLAQWLKQHGVAKVALLQGGLAWPWQVETQRRRPLSGPLNLAYWLEHEGPDALARVGPEAAWQPVMLALRDQFALFLVKPSSAGGPYPLPVNRDASRTLASMLASGGFAAEYPKQALDRLIDRLADCHPKAVEESLSFFAAESRGHWHNRARAKIARRLKHCELDDIDRQRIVRVIERRLVEGRFSEQFKDQLRLMLRLDADAAARASASAQQHAAPYVRMYGAWLADRVAAGRTATSPS